MPTSLSNTFLGSGCGISFQLPSDWQKIGQFSVSIRDVNRSDRVIGTDAGVCLEILKQDGVYASQMVVWYPICSADEPEENAIPDKERGYTTPHDSIVPAQIHLTCWMCT